MTEVYIVGYGYDYEGVTIVAVYTNKQKADQLRQTLAESNKGHYQFVQAEDLDPVTVNV